MNGIPKPHKRVGRDGRQVVELNPVYWYHIQRYGKNRLVPYLGLMSSYSIGVCILLLMINYPKLNATALYHARIESDDGRPILLSAAGENNDELRLTVAKPRANENKSVRLNPFCEELVNNVLRWTRPIREELRRQGREKEARYLWVGISAVDYSLRAFSAASILNTLRASKKFRSLGERANVTRAIPFVDRHPALTPWSEKLTYKAIRINVGILKYLDMDGDLVATAKIFGHKNIKTTIGHYIPLELRQTIYERQIRRHQNYLIVSSLENDIDKLAASDFSNIEELHCFLNGLSIPIDAYRGTQPAPHELNARHKAENNKILVNDDPRTLAVAMLYRDKLRSASSAFLDLPDRRTGLAPRFWVEFVDSLALDLPLAMRELSSLVNKAKKIKKELTGKIKLPEVY